MSNLAYNQIDAILAKHFANRLSLHKNTQDIYLDDQLFDLGQFRFEVNQVEKTLLTNDKHIHELVRLHAAKNPVSPIEDYLNSCLSKYSDLDYREVFEHLNQHVLHIEPNSLESHYLPKTLVGAVKRIYKPGCQHDTVLILKSEQQGLYKTSFFRELAGAAWFTSVIFNRYDVDELMNCHRHWFIELGECEGTIKLYNMAKLKNFLSKPSDTFRKPYAASPITLPRQFILVGTTNNDKFLSDPTGNRRFWVIPINQKIDIEWVKKHRDLIWAAAVLAYKDGYSSYLTEEEQALSDSINSSNYQEEDVWTEPVTAWLSTHNKPFTISDVLTQAIGKHPANRSRADESRVSTILNTLGLPKPEKTTRVGGVLGRYYLPCNRIELT